MGWGGSHTARSESLGVMCERWGNKQMGREGRRRKEREQVTIGKAILRGVKKNNKSFPHMEQSPFTLVETSTKQRESSPQTAFAQTRNQINRKPC